LRLLPSVLAGHLYRLVTTSVSPEILKAYLSGLTGALRLFPKMLQKRKGIQQRRRVSDAYVHQLLRGSSRMVTQSRRRRIRDQLILRFQRG
jgi:hypothetical protein